MVRSASGYGVTTYTFELTELGTQHAERALRQCEYAGAAPVPLTDYAVMVYHQTVRQIEIDEKWVRKSLSQLVLNNKLLEQIGPAFNSGRSIFLYGPPGTGKSSIAEGLAQSLTGQVYIPYAVEVDGHVLSVYDPAIHVKVEIDDQQDVKLLDREEKLTHDPRWLICHRPMAMVGGELDINSLDLDYDPVSKFYEAPIHMKAANGVFILDDFGRQQIAPRVLLNRWIVPLERGTDFLELHTGKKFEVPFDQITIFCTNLKPSELVDEAFLRRIRHKILVGYQTEDEFLETLHQVCKLQGLACESSMAEYLLNTYYRSRKRPLVGSHPRDIVDQIMDRARFKKIKPEMNQEAIDAAAANYFVEL
jgi:DNA polymerase III delta prime subunit